MLSICLIPGGRAGAPPTFAPGPPAPAPSNPSAPVHVHFVIPLGYFVEWNCHVVVAVHGVSSEVLIPQEHEQEHRQQHKVWPHVHAAAVYDSSFTVNDDVFQYDIIAASHTAVRVRLYTSLDDM